MSTSPVTRRIAAIALAAGCVFGVGVGAASAATAAETSSQSTVATAVVTDSGTASSADFSQAQVQFKNSTDAPLTIDFTLRDGSSFMRLTRTLQPGESTLGGLYAKLQHLGTATDYMNATVHYANGNTSKIQLVQADDGQQLVDAMGGEHTSSVNANESASMWIADNQTQGDDPTSFHKMTLERAANSGTSTIQGNFTINVLK